MKKNDMKSRILLATIMGMIDVSPAPNTISDIPATDKDKQCRGCEHKEYPDDGWCYMFKEFQPGCVLNKSGK